MTIDERIENKMQSLINLEAAHQEVLQKSEAIDEDEQSRYGNDIKRINSDMEYLNMRKDALEMQERLNSFVPYKEPPRRECPLLLVIRKVMRKK